MITKEQLEERLKAHKNCIRNNEYPENNTEEIDNVEFVDNANFENEDFIIGYDQGRLHTLEELLRHYNYSLKVSFALAKRRIEWYELACKNRNYPYEELMKLEKARYDLHLLEMQYDSLTFWERIKFYFNLI